MYAELDGINADGKGEEGEGWDQKQGKGVNEFHMFTCRTRDRLIYGDGYRF